MIELAHDDYLLEHSGTGSTLSRIVPRPLRGYKSRWLRDDLVAAITVAALVLPLGIAFAELAGLPAVYGLYTSIVPVIVFGLIASTPQAVVGAEAALSGIVAAAIAPVIAQGHSPVEAAAALSLMIGLVCLVGSALHAGILAQLVSRTVFVGYLAGVAVSVSISQLPRLLGAAPFYTSPLWRQMGELTNVFTTASAASTILGIATLAAVLLGRLFTPGLPAALFMIVLTGAGVKTFGLESLGVAVVGELPTGLPGLVIPGLGAADYFEMLPAAIAIAVVGFADTTLVSQGFAARNRYRVDSSRDLAALGCADVASGLLGGLPVSASSARTAVAESSGAHSQLAPILSAVVISAVLLVFSGLVGWIPLPALGGIIIAIMVGIIDGAAIRALMKGRRSELIVAIVAFAGVAAVGVLEGVLIAVALSIAVSALRAARPHDALLGRVEGEERLVALDENPRARAIPGTVVFRFDAPLFFGNAETFRSHLMSEIDDSTQTIRLVVVVGAAITDIDFTATQILSEMGAQLHDQGITFVVAGLNHKLLAEVRRTAGDDSNVVFTSKPAETVIHDLEPNAKPST